HPRRCRPRPPTRRSSPHCRAGGAPAAVSVVATPLCRRVRVVSPRSRTASACVRLRPPHCRAPGPGAAAVPPKHPCNIRRTRYHQPAMRLYRSIVTASILTTAVALANTAFAAKIHGDAESLAYNGISNLLQEDPSLVNLKDAQGRTPPLCAFNSIFATCNADGMKKTIDVLLVSHADIHARDKDGNTVLHYAVRQGLDFVTLFVSSDRKLVTATNDIQQTPLHTAVQL